ncbi:AAA family ATPase [Fodinibius halophilus]|uniref:MoxR family ATPase n=1 Tax=Fodinibius halophilus TaxID=1736908 RepID=A0A6M1T2M0_9BACT|nr:MoxR family ATPase [Fodinibius halophilus]NGP88277.1 MoxR family ATPase [Fodinibius halophilus]
MSKQPDKNSTNSNTFAPAVQDRTDLSGIKTLADNLRSEIGKIIVGQERMVDLLITALLANGHVLVEGVPGVAKTLTARLFARTLSTDFSRIQFTPDLMPADVIGTSVFNPETTEFNFKEGPVFSNVVLIDEINRSPAKTQAALFEVMQERQISVDGTTYTMEEPFIILATQNPIEHEGTYKLPEAQLDRFLFKINVGYPEQKDETAILEGVHQRKNQNDPSQLDAVVKADKLIQNQALVSDIHVEKSLMHYITSITQHSRNHPAIHIGASPRAAVFMMRAAQAWAAINGRDFVIPDDIQDIAQPVLRHRLILTPEKEMEGTSTDEVITRIIKQIEVPR